MSDSKVREAFAAHMDRIHGPGYRARYGMGEWWEDPSAADEWAAWQASRAAALEEAAKVAETHYLRECPTLCGQSIAAAIRALAGLGGAGKGGSDA